MLRTLAKVAAVSFLAFFSLGGSAKEQLGSGLTSEPASLPLENYAEFPTGARLNPRIQFWVDIYSKYNSWQAILHDKTYPFVVYGVAESTNREKRAAHFRTDAIKKSAQQALLKLHKNRAAIEAGKFLLSAQEQRLYESFRNIPGDEKFLEASKDERFRRQSGMRDQLELALFRAGRYLPRMKQVFRDEGLPEEIAYLPFVESSFNLEAVSKVGASGIWQFMPGTGRDFLHVDEVVDERNDPMRSALAAAKLMKQNYETLGVWPLAVTAYNHGRLGIQRAVKSVGSHSLEDIVASYGGPNFGFASSNFYASFMAAKHVAKNYKHYLGDVSSAGLLEFDEFVMTDFVDVNILAKYLEIPVADLRQLNPALSESVWRGEYLVPVAYVLRIPLKARENFLSRYESIPSAFKLSHQQDKPTVALPPAVASLQ